MKILKIKLGLFSLLAVLAASVFFTSCEQENIIPSQTTLEPEIQQAKFKKDIIINSDDNNEIKLTVSTNENSLLELVDENSFTIEPIFEAPQIPNNEDETPLEFDSSDDNSDTFLKISVDDQNLPKNAIGFKINFNNNEEINSRYNRVSTYWYSNSHRKIYTRNTAYTSIKMKYYDDWRYAGYRSLCSGPCSQQSHVFSRWDKGVGCKYEYWSYAYRNVTIYFYN